MKLTAKLIAALVVAISAVMALNAHLRSRTETALLEADTARELRAIGNAVATGTDMVWRHAGEAQARRFVRDADRARDDVQVRWVSLEEPEGPAEAALSPARIERLKEGRSLSFVWRVPGEPEDRRFFYLPLTVEGGSRTAIEISRSLAAQRQFLLSSWRIRVFTTVGLTVVCTVIMAAAGYWLVGRPLDRLRDKARQVGQGCLQPPLVLRQRDEMGELARELNATCDLLAEAQEAALREAEHRIATVEQLRHADRLRTVGQLASGVAHELGTPLNVALGNAKLILEGDLAREEVGSAAEVVVEQVNRMAAIIRQLLDFSRQRGPSFAATDLVDLTRRTLQMLQPMADRDGVLLELRAMDDLVGEIDGSQVQQALANLVVNAIQASPSGGRVEVSVEATPRNPARDGWAILRVADEGPGIPVQNQGRVFEPFFTTKDVGDGTGLGLAVAYGIVQEHGGEIDFESVPGSTRFSIRLPLRRSVGSEILREAS